MDLGEGQRPHTARKLLLGWAREIAMERGQHRDGNSESLLDLRRRVQEGKTKLLRASHGLAGRVGDSQRASPTLARQTAESLLPAGPRMRAECAGKHADGGQARKPEPDRTPAALGGSTLDSHNCGSLGRPWEGLTCARVQLPLTRRATTAQVSRRFHQGCAGNGEDGGAMGQRSDVTGPRERLNRGPRRLTL